MTTSELARRASLAISRNSPTILTSLGAAGVITTAVLATKATVEATRRIDNFYDPESQTIVKPSRREIFKETWTLYIPTAITGGVSIMCIFGANNISSRRTAALVGAYSLSETALREYREKVTEHIGEVKEQKVRDEIAQDRVKDNPPISELVISDKADVLCYETMTGRYFTSNMEKLRKAQNDINQTIINGMYVLLNDFYEKIGLKRVQLGDELGWNTDKILELEFSSVLTEKGEPVLSISYRHNPFPSPYSVF